MAKQKKFLIIDANSLIHRAYHALPPLTTKDGQLVNAVFGFVNIFLKALRDIKPDYLAVCFDVAGGTFRDKIYEGYKAGRAEKPQEFYDQFEIIKDLLDAFNVKRFELPGYEADDLIGTLTNLNIKVKSEKLKNVVLSGDMDLLQLVDSATEVESVRKGVSETVTYTPQGVKDRFGFTPAQLIDFKALRGDPSDNIPGVPGIGEKTATGLIQEFGSLEKLYKYADRQKNKGPRTKSKVKAGVLDKLLEYKTNAYLSKKLVTIDRKAPVKCKLADVAVRQFDQARVVKIIQDLGFKSLLNRLPKIKPQSLFETNQGSGEPKDQSAKAQKNKKIDYVLVDSAAKLKKFLNELKKQKIFALDTETSQTEAVGAELVGMSLSWRANTGYYIPNLKSYISSLKSVLENPSIKKIGHNIKYDCQIIKQVGINLQGIEFDTMIASYLINPGSRSHSLSTLAFQEFGHQMIPITDLIGDKKNQQISMADVPSEKVAVYAAEDADFTWQLCQKLAAEKNFKHVNHVFTDIEMPLVSVLADMELVGIKIDVPFLKKLSKRLTAKIKTLEAKIHKLARQKFNVASPNQLKEILFDKLNIPTAGLSRTKTGISTSAQDLEKLKGRHQIIEPILEFRELAKLKNTYTDTLPELANQKTGRVHTSFNQTVTATGRLSSSSPNLQNIPIRTDLGLEIRKAFVAERGFKLVSADYSQFELRIAASLSNDKRMIQAFRQNEDIHKKTAAEVYDIPLDKVTRQQRREAKEVNFGIIYGLGPRGMALRTGIGYDRAKQFYDKYFLLHPQLADYLKTVVATTRSLGFTETLFGRRRYFPEINAEHPVLRTQAERAAVNMPIQGSQADLIKIAMLNLAKEIKHRYWQNKVKMLLQVHDELVFEVKNELVGEASSLIKNIMEKVYKLKVPIQVHVGDGQNWAECK